MSSAEDRGFAFARRLAKMPALGPQEEQELLVLATRGDKRAIDKLVTGNLHHVAKLALMHARRSRLPPDELVSVGVSGMMEAIPKFDPSRGHRFITYATWWVQLHMKRLVLQSRTNVAEDRSSWLVDVYRLTVEAGRKGLSIEATVDYVTSKVPGRRERIASVVGRIRQRDVSIEGLHVDTGWDVEDTSPLPNEVLEADAEEKRKRAVIAEALNRLLPRERRVIELRIMVEDGDEVQILESIGREWGVTRERVRQIEQQAISKLRESLAPISAEEKPTPAEERRERARPRVLRNGRELLTRQERSAITRAAVLARWQRKKAERLAQAAQSSPG